VRPWNPGIAAMMRLAWPNASSKASCRPGRTNSSACSRITRQDATGRPRRELEGQRSRIREAYLQPSGERPASTARGLHHTALISSDAETTVRFYQDPLGER
jgi:hypothetical protein